MGGPTNDDGEESAQGGVELSAEERRRGLDDLVDWCNERTRRKRQWISVLTTPARPQYLSATCAALFASGAAVRPGFVYSDGTSSASCPGWDTFDHDGPPNGDRHSMWKIFLRAAKYGATTLLYLEDDARPSDDAVNIAFAEGVPDHLAFVSLYDSHEFKRSAYLKPGLHEVPIMGSDGKGLRGAVALLIPRRTIDWALRTRPDATGIPQGSDAALSWALRDGPWKMRGIREPSLFEHVGDVSALGHAAHQRASWFAGDSE